MTNKNPPTKPPTQGSVMSLLCAVKFDLEMIEATGFGVAHVTRRAIRQLEICINALKSGKSAYEVIGTEENAVPEPKYKPDETQEGG